MEFLSACASAHLARYYRGEYVPTPAGTKLVYKWYEELAFMMTVNAIVALFVLGIFFYMEEAVMDLTPQVTE